MCYFVVLECCVLGMTPLGKSPWLGVFVKSFMFKRGINVEKKKLSVC